MQQLCAQIRRVIELTLAGDFDDEVLQNISVQSVTPAPGSRANVMMTVHPPGSSLERGEVLARLEAARPRIVEEIARSVERRSLPELSFWIVREGEEPPSSSAD